MATVFALLVGIDRYLDPDIPDLRGCRTDLAGARAFLAARLAGAADLDVCELLDLDATRDAVVAGFRSHLARARPGDTALFWFSGHGSLARVPRELWHLEPDGRTLQTLVCADSRVDGRPDLLDKELAVLLADVAAGGGHVVTVLDCCHAGGATRGPGVRYRAARPAPSTAVGRLLPDVLDRYRDGPPPVRHVSLAACLPSESAGEELIDGAWRGRFTWALLRAWSRCGPETTYRDLLAVTRGEVERRTTGQRPHLFPPGRGPGDERLFGTGPGADRPGVTMRYGRAGWEIDAGACHGIEAGPPDDPTRLAVAGPVPAGDAVAGDAVAGDAVAGDAVAGDAVAGDVVVAAVGTVRSRVEPVAWRPDPHRAYPVVLTRVPSPGTTLAAGDGLNPGVARDLRAAAAAGGPHLRFVTDGADVTLYPGAAGGVTAADRDRRPLRTWPPGTGAGRIVRDLEHIARWRLVRGLANPVSRLHDAVAIEVVEPLADETVAPPDRRPMPLTATGEIRLVYWPDGGFWRPPRVFVRLRNRTRQPLHCVLLDLTDRYAVHSGLFPGAALGAGCVAAAGEGALIEFTIPADRSLGPGASATDRLMAVFAGDEFSALPFELPRIGTAATMRTVHRDVRPASTGRGDRVGDWATVTLSVVTGIPTYGSFRPR